MPLSWTRFTVILVTLAVVLAVFVWHGVPVDWQKWHVESTVAPRLARYHGFTFAEVPFQAGDGNFAVLAITGMTPGGQLHRAGFQAGDIPVGQARGQLAGFFHDLDRARTARVTIRVMRHADPKQGLWGEEVELGLGPTTYELWWPR